MAPVCLPCYDTETLLSYIVEDSGVDELIFNQTSVALRILLPKADAEAGLRVIDTKASAAVGTGGGGGGGFKKGGFKSSFTTVKGPVVPTAPTKKNVLGDDDDEDEIPESTYISQRAQATQDPSDQPDYAESDTDAEYSSDTMGSAYYDPLKPTGCFAGCVSTKNIPIGTAAVKG
ncbi:unnamed protein product [Aspergillus oryzae]|nr:unnamed protein product [Aspergillus oryzae]